MPSGSSNSKPCCRGPKPTALTLFLVQVSKASSRQPQIFCLLSETTHPFQRNPGLRVPASLLCWHPPLGTGLCPSTPRSQMPCRPSKSPCKCPVEWPDCFPLVSLFFRSSEFYHSRAGRSWGSNRPFPPRAQQGSHAALKVGGANKWGEFLLDSQCRAESFSLFPSGSYSWSKN